MNFELMESLESASENLIGNIRRIHPEIVTPANWSAIQTVVVQALENQTTLIREITNQIHAIQSQIELTQRYVDLNNKNQERQSLGRHDQRRNDQDWPRTETGEPTGSRSIFRWFWRS